MRFKDQLCNLSESTENWLD